LFFPIPAAHKTKYDQLPLLAFWPPQ